MTRDDIYLGGQVIREFPYRPGWVLLILCLVMFGTGSIVLSKVAIENDRGVIINGLIRLGPDGATVFYWSLAALSILFSALGVLLFYVRLTTFAQIVVTVEGIYVPKRPLLTKVEFIAFPRIVALSERRMSRQRFLYLYHDGGKCSVVASMLPTKNDLDALIGLIRERTRLTEVL
jgi:hypothetical protein